MHKRIKIPTINIKKLINNLNKSKKEKIIIEINKNKISREKLYIDILKTQNYLISIGVKKNHKIVSLLENSYEQVLLFLAAIGLGATDDTDWKGVGRGTKFGGVKIALCFDYRCYWDSYWGFSQGKGSSESAERSLV